jgi:hypothetical protein
VGFRFQWFIIAMDALVDPSTHRGLLSFGGAVPTM